MEDEGDNSGCIGECNIVICRETRQDGDGKDIVEDIERCTRCGLVFSREVLAGRYSDGNAPAK